MPAVLARARQVGAAHATPRAGKGARRDGAVGRGPSIQAATAAVALAHPVPRAPARARHELALGAVRAVLAGAGAIYADATAVAVRDARLLGAGGASPLVVALARPIHAPTAPVAVRCARAAAAIEAPKPCPAVAGACDRVTVAMRRAVVGTGTQAAVQARVALVAAASAGCVALAVPTALVGARTLTTRLACESRVAEAGVTAVDERARAPTRTTRRAFSNWRLREAVRGGQEEGRQHRLDHWTVLG